MAYRKPKVPMTVKVERQVKRELVKFRRLLKEDSVSSLTSRLLEAFVSGRYIDHQGVERVMNAEPRQ